MDGELAHVLVFAVGSDAMITVAVNSITSFASGFVIFMFLVMSMSPAAVPDDSSRLGLHE